MLRFARKTCRRRANADLQVGICPRPGGALPRLFCHLPKEDNRNSSGRSRDSVAEKRNGNYHTVGNVSLNPKYCTRMKPIVGKHSILLPKILQGLPLPKIENRVWSLVDACFISGGHSSFVIAFPGASFYALHLAVRRPARERERQTDREREREPEQERKSERER